MVGDGRSARALEMVVEVTVTVPEEEERKGGK